MQQVKISLSTWTVFQILKIKFAFAFITEWIKYFRNMTKLLESNQENNWKAARFNVLQPTILQVYLIWKHNSSG